MQFTSQNMPICAVKSRKTCSFVQFMLFFACSFISFYYFCITKPALMNRFTNILSDQKDELSAVNIAHLCPRREEGQIDLNSNLAQIVIGVRRSGKSTLCQKVLMQSGVQFAYVNFDDERLAGIQSADLNALLQALYEVYGAFTHLFLDEVQNVEAWPLFVNRLLRQHHRVIMTGSNANLLSSDLVTHMTGRYNEIRLYPFSFAEYCTFHQIDTHSLTTKAEGLRGHALNEYLLHGGFPELLQDASLHPQTYVQSLLRAIVEKDICRRYKVRYKQTIYQLTNYMLDVFCQEKSYNTIANDLQVKTIHTIKNYLGYLDNAYLLRHVNKFSFKSIERNTARKCYAVDLAFISQRENALQTENLGWRLENVVAIELMRRIEHVGQEIYYLREGRSYEVDFAVVDGGHVTRLIQVTYDFTNPRTKLYNREIGGLVKGARATHCSNLTLVMMAGEEGDLTVDGLIIHRVLAAHWLLDQL